ncbi:substrate-binding domain-containing protein [Geodermatophilus sp. SYSU D01186]
MTVNPRHAAPENRGRRLRRSVLSGGAAVLVLTGATAVTLGVRAADGCDPHRAVLEVAASPDIAPAVTRTARGLVDAAGCPEVRVRARSTAEVLADARHDRGRVPGVWIPDSSLSVEQARAADLTPSGPVSVASSPLVFAVPRARAGDQPDRRWADVVGAVSAGRLALHVHGGGSSPATVGAVRALQAALADRPDGRAALAAVLRAARVADPPTDTAAALAALGPAADGVVAVPEQAVSRHAGSAGAAPVLAVYPDGTGTPFDYPFTVLRTGAATEAAAARLLTALRGAAGQAALREDGFRGADGAGTGLTAQRGVDGSRTVPVEVPDPAVADGVARTLAAVRRDARLLAVVDVSGSMAADVPGTEGTTRLDLALGATAAGLALYPDTTEVGLWAFSEGATAADDHRELVPIGPLTAAPPRGRYALSQAVAGLQPVPDGGTALYDTTLAAVRAVREGWDPDRVNAVVVLTDGEDTDDSGIGLDALLATLRAEGEDRPVPVITIAYGDAAGAEALAAISAATGGTGYRTSDPGRIRDVFLDAVAHRVCRPQCPPG